MLRRYARGSRSAVVEDPITYKGKASEPGRSHARPGGRCRAGPLREGDSRTPETNGCEKSDPLIVAMKPANEVGRPGEERVERRGGAEGNAAGKARTGLSAGSCVSQASARMRTSRWSSRRPLPPPPEVGAGCGKAARPDLCGGRAAMRVPTAILNSLP